MVVKSEGVGVGSKMLGGVSNRSPQRHHASDCAVPPHLPHVCRLQHGDPGDQKQHPVKRPHLATTSLQSGAHWTPYVDLSPYMEGTIDNHEDE